MGRELTTIFPSPGRMRTRATACLRRPVDWTSGFGMLATDLLLRRAPGAGHLERLGLLGGVGMVGTGVDLELLELLAPERALREHPPDRPAHDLGGLALQEV